MLRPTLCILVAIALLAPCHAGNPNSVPLPNPGFEVSNSSVPDGWEWGVGGAAKAEITVDRDVYHSGRQSVRIANRSPFEPFVFALFGTGEIPVKPNTTYVLRFWAKGKAARKCHTSISYGAVGDHVVHVQDGDFDWREYRVRFTTPVGVKAIRVRFGSEDVTEAFWVDDVSLSLSTLQLANLKERTYPKDYAGVFPRSPSPVAEHLVVFDTRPQPADADLLVAALQGIVNRRSPRLYAINKTNPAGMDEEWLRYMQEKQYTGKQRVIGDLSALVKLFRPELTGTIIYDDDLPGSVHAATMLAGIKSALPVSQRLAGELRLPVVMDLRGKWKRNVDAYRYVYTHYWDKMNHHMLAWFYPGDSAKYVMDYVVQFRIFTFWMSNYGVDEKGADPAAEEEFIDELLAATPGNVPVLGWPDFGAGRGVPEYTGVRWLSEYGKFVPGTGYSSNWSIHSAIHPPDSAFARPDKHESDVTYSKDKVYLSIGIFEGSDALWYWQHFQRGVWDDPRRGSVPIGYCMNVTLYDTFPLVAQWYYEHATPNDQFFCGPSGLGYMNTQLYASRFRESDRKRIWREMARQTDSYCRKMDIQGVELYNGAWSAPTPPSPDTFSYLTHRMKDLRFIFSDFGRHDCITPSNANTMVNGTPVFHTLTRYQAWASAEDTQRYDRTRSVDWLVKDIQANSPNERPGFMSTMAVSWYFFPSWIEEVARKLPPQYVLVNPYQLARLYAQHGARGR